MPPGFGITPNQEYITPQSVQHLIQLCIGSWSSVIGSYDVIIPYTSEGNPGSRGDSRIKNNAAPSQDRPCAGLECTHDIIRSDDARPRPYAELDQVLHTLGGGV